MSQLMIIAVKNGLDSVFLEHVLVGISRCHFDIGSLQYKIPTSMVQLRKRVKINIWSIRNIFKIHIIYKFLYSVQIVQNMKGYIQG